MDIYEVFNKLRYHHEDEVVEFKKAENNFDFDDLGKYFSALSNEANLNRDSIRDYHEMVLGDLERDVNKESRKPKGGFFSNMRTRCRQRLHTKS